MNDKEIAVWRGAYDLFEWNHSMPNTEVSWQDFISSVTAFANEFDWKNCPLAHRLADAVILAVEDEVKLRMAEESMHPAQLSFFQEDSS